jgi:hypothetical protein
MQTWELADFESVLRIEPHVKAKNNRGPVRRQKRMRIHLLNNRGSVR